MRKGSLLLLLSIILLILAFLPLHLILPGQITSTGYYRLSKNDVNGPTQSLPAFYVSILDVEIEKYGGMVIFYITDSDNAIVYYENDIQNGYHLEWKPNRIYDTYTFNFECLYAWKDPIVLSYTLRIYPYALIFLISGILFLFLGIIQILREDRYLKAKEPVS
jgi:hypothetical protein